MFFKRKKIEIPLSLLEELKKLKEEKDNKIEYSISVSDDVSLSAVKEIKDTELEPNFRDLLFSYIDKLGLTDPEVYKKALVDKRTFSKIRTGEVKRVSRKTAIRLALSLELELDDVQKLLKANYDYLGDNTYFDVAIKWCIKNKIYDIDQVNDILYACDLDLLTK